MTTKTIISSTFEYLLKNEANKFKSVCKDKFTHDDDESYTSFRYYFDSEITNVKGKEKEKFIHYIILKKTDNKFVVGLKIFHDCFISKVFQFSFKTYINNTYTEEQFTYSDHDFKDTKDKIISDSCKYIINRIVKNFTYDEFKIIINIYSMMLIGII